MMSPHHTSWAQVAEVAEEAFKVLGRQELIWARHAWDQLDHAGLIEHGSELARHRTAVRFLALASIFREFCHLAWKKRVTANLYDWAVFLELQPVRIGQLLGPDARLPKKGKDTDILSAALEILVERERPVLHEALLAAYGSASKLFIAMWRVRESDDQVKGLAPRESDDEIVNDLSFEKIDAYEFVSKGFAARR